MANLKQCCLLFWQSALDNNEATHEYYHDYTVGNPSSIKVHLDISVKIQELVHTALVFNGEDVCMVSAAILDSNNRVCH